MNGVALDDQVERADDAHGGEHEENNERSVHLAAAPEKRGGGNHDVGKGNREQELPAKGHELVVAETRKGATHPHIHEKEDKNLGKQPEGPLNEGVDLREKEKGDAHRGDDRADRGQNEPAKNGFVSDAVPNHPQAGGDEQN